MEQKKDLNKEGEFSLQKLFSNPRFLYGAAIGFTIVLAVVCVDLYNALQHNKKVDEFQLDVSELQEYSNTNKNFYVLNRSELNQSGLSNG